MSILESARTPEDKEALHVISLTADSHFLFGMNWTPLLGGRLAKVGRKRARLLQATHYLVGSEPGAVLGYVKVKESMVSQKASLYSAAMQYARAFPSGTVACVLPHPEYGYWLVAAHEGAVLVKTDKWFAQLEQVDALLEVLNARFPNLAVCRLPLFDASSAPDWLCAVPHDQSSLTRLTKPRRHSFLVGVSILVMLVLLFMTKMHGSPNIEPEVVPNQRAHWEDALRKVAEAYPIHTALHIARIMEHWRRAPLYGAGWKLKHIQCEPRRLEWRCMARYNREHRLALNQTLASITPPGWSFQSIDLDHAVLTWIVEDTAQPFDLKTMPPSEDWMSYLQHVSSVFESVQISSSNRLTINAPLDDHGAPSTRPDDVLSWQKRTISIKGPLRSFAALSGLTTPFHWRNISLSVDAMSGSGIASSQLVVQLIGDLFETVQ